MLRSLAAKENKDHEYVSLDDLATCDAVLCMTDKFAAKDQYKLPNISVRETSPSQL